MDSELFDERVLRACSRAARKVIVVNRRYVEYGDVLHELYVWVAANYDYVQRWKEQGTHGMNKLFVALYREGHGFVARERVRRTGCQPGDFYYYTPAVLEELLPDVWEYEAWDSSGSSEDPTMPRGKSKPSEKGDRRAMMIDIAYSVTTLEVEEQRFLRARYTEPTLTWDELGKRFEITGEAARKRNERLLEKMVDRLGGEPPVWRNSRRARSNASAQAELHARGES